MALEAERGGSLFLLVQGGRLRRRLIPALERMKLPFSIIGTTAILLCGGCATTTQPDPGKVYSGTYFYNFESSSFTPDGTDTTWCLGGNMEQAELPAKGASGPWGTAHVVVRGTLSSPGHYCNLGASKYVLTVNQVLKVSDKRAQEP